jgi:hypothetical protein
MLLRSSEHIAAALERAGACKRRGEAATDPEIKAEFLYLEESWTLLARSYEFAEASERFMLTAHNHPNRDVANDPASPDQGQRA